VNKCQLCGKPLDPRLAEMRSALTPAVRQELLRRSVADHVAAGVCPACVAEAVAHRQRERSVSSLHGTTEPHTTFPYYHRHEETLLAQPQQLPDYFTLPATGVTIAFLDSGYYPHPDLAVAAQWPGEAPPWHRLNQQQLRAAPPSGGICGPYRSGRAGRS
jgi:serine protease AprX